MKRKKDLILSKFLLLDRGIIYTKSLNILNYQQKIAFSNTDGKKLRLMELVGFAKVPNSWRPKPKLEKLFHNGQLWHT